jgi:hypothetical protein
MVLRKRRRCRKNLLKKRFSKSSTLKSSFIMILSGRSSSHSIPLLSKLKLKRRMSIGKPNIFNPM